jgi:SpoVK/Ycf46/Vps4 family AAA+-type ATPase
MKQIVQQTNGYSSADLAAVVKDAAMAPLRDLPKGKSIMTV